MQAVTRISLFKQLTWASLIHLVKEFTQPKPL